MRLGKVTSLSGHSQLSRLMPIVLLVYLNCRFLITIYIKGIVLQERSAHTHQRKK